MAGYAGGAWYARDWFFTAIFHGSSEPFGSTTCPNCWTSFVDWDLSNRMSNIFRNFGDPYMHYNELFWLGILVFVVGMGLMIARWKSPSGSQVVIAQPGGVPQTFAQPGGPQYLEGPTKYCKYCGARISADSKFCGQCGRQLEKRIVLAP